MANIQRYLDDISTAIYGEDVRGSIHDAIDIINKVGEKVLTLGTDVTGPNSPATGYYDGSLYLNLNTSELWKYNGSLWVSQGSLRGTNIRSITKTETNDHVDTYTINLSNNTTGGTFTVTNANGLMIGTLVTSANTSTVINGTQCYNGDVYINSNTWDVWKCNGSGWTKMGTITGPTGPQGPQGVQGIQGPQGIQGVSPSVSTVKEGKVTTVTITDATGPHTFQVNDGQDGSGTGDMVKATYDQNDNGIVDLAENLVSSVIDDAPVQASTKFVRSGGVYSAIARVKGEVTSQTLTAGSTSVTFTNLPTTGDYLVDFFTSNGSPYSELDTSVSGQVTVIFEAQLTNITVYMRIQEV